MAQLISRHVLLQDRRVELWVGAHEATEEDETAGKQGEDAANGHRDGNGDGGFVHTATT